MAFPNYPGAENWGVRVGKASSREGSSIDSLVVHAMAGSYEGSMRWANDSSNTSFHYGVALDGRVGQAVDEQWAAWHAGNWDMNKRSVGIEHEDRQQATSNPNWFSDKMFDSSTKLAAYLCKKYNIPVSRIFLHKDVSLLGTACPGNYFPLARYKERVSALLGGSGEPSDGNIGDYPNISRYAFSTAPVASLNKGYTITYGGKPIGIFYPATETEAKGLPKLSRYQFSIANVPHQLTKKLALTYAGKVFGIFNPNVVYKEISVVPKGFKPLPVRAGNYQDRHPTRYEWRRDVEDIVRSLYKQFPNLIHINTYVDHPEDWARDTTSFDVWGVRGRNDPVGFAVGDKILNILFNDPTPPHIDWIIWRRRIWSRSTGVWQPFGSNPFEWHDDHIHVTYIGNAKRLQ